MRDDPDPAAALAMATAARRRMAADIFLPRWYAPLYGLGCGGMIASQALTGSAATVGTVASLLLITSLYAVWSRQAGVSVSSYRAGTARPIAFALVTALLLLLGMAVVARHRFGINWAPLACGAIAAVVATLASRAWDRRWLAEMARPL